MDNIALLLGPVGSQIDEPVLILSHFPRKKGFVDVVAACTV
ncbi:hypothetical protein [Undibacterium terreum]|nr:hypothetical protein [Undibacterium terreum]